MYTDKYVCLQTSARNHLAESDPRGMIPIQVAHSSAMVQILVFINTDAIVCDAIVCDEIVCDRGMGARLAGLSRIIR